MSVAPRSKTSTSNSPAPRNRGRKNDPAVALPPATRVLAAPQGRGGDSEPGQGKSDAGPRAAPGQGRARLAPGPLRPDRVPTQQPGALLHPDPADSVPGHLGERVRQSPRRSKRHRSEGVHLLRPRNLRYGGYRPPGFPPVDLVSRGAGEGG